MSKTILIGCKLPSGLVLDGPRGEPIELNGQNTSMVLGGFGLTHVPESIWAYLEMTYEQHAAFKSKSIFTAGNASVAEVAAVADELEGERTGFEGLDPHKPAPGLQPENTANLNKELKQNANAAPKGKAKGKADQAAALELMHVKA